MKFFRQPRQLLLTALFAVTLSLTSARAFGAPITGANVIVSYPELTGTVGGVYSTSAYHQASDSYYVGVFGATQGLLRVTRTSPGDPWVSDAYVESRTGAFPSDMLRFIRSSDVPGGVVDANHSGTSLISGLLLNPQPLTISVPQADSAGNPTGTMQSITYQPGELAFITDGGTQVNDGSTNRFDWTKKLYRWDLRAIGDATTADPDYSTGTSGVSSNPNPGGFYGALNQADWNDVFTVVMTEQQMRDTYESTTGNTISSSSQDNFGRQFAWSTDGQSIYAVDTGNQGGGVYKIGAATGSIQLIYSEDDTGAGSNLLGEPAVLHTSVRNLGSGFGAGEQVLFDGSDFNGNPGGMSYLVDTGSAVSTPQVLFSGAELTAYTGLSAGGVDSIATDSSGNIYFVEGGTGSIHKLDAQGRFISVLNRAQLMELNETHDGARSNGGVLLRLQVREDSSGTTLTFRGDNSYLGAVRIFDPADLNKDEVVDQADRDFFISQFNKTFHGDAPDPFNSNDAGEIPAFIDYIAADLNGDGRPRTGSSTLPGLTAGGVGLDDLDVLTQFIDLALGDFDWDGAPLDEEDLAIFNLHFNVDPSVFGYDAYSWFDGDVSGPGGAPDGLVDMFDFLFLQSSGLNVPEPASLAAMLLCMATLALFRSRLLARK